ncbi:MAG TPA: hypothetical protein VGF69_26400 [Thermoanaerobaculia bacterium]
MKRHIAAIGGAERWQKVDSLLLKGSGPVGTFVWVWKSPNKVRTEERDDTSGKTLITATDGSTAWMSNPFRGPSAPRRMNQFELRSWQTGLAMRSDLLDLPVKTSEVALVGQEKLGNRQAYKLSVRRAGREDVTVWIDTQSFLLLQRAYTAIAPWGAEETIPVVFSDYRSVDGVMIPHQIGSTRYTVDVNAEIGDALFQPPQPLK